MTIKSLDRIYICLLPQKKSMPCRVDALTCG
jgi:hypothetical protein